MSAHAASDASHPVTLSGDEPGRIDICWRACHDLAVGMICLSDDPRLREPLPFVCLGASESRDR